MQAIKFAKLRARVYIERLDEIIEAPHTCHIRHKWMYIRRNAKKNIGNFKANVSKIHWIFIEHIRSFKMNL